MILPMGPLARLLVIAALAGQASLPSPLQVFHRARALAPGEAVLVDVKSRDVIDEVQAEWMGGRITFFAVGDNTWQGVAPIDLAAKPGTYTMVISARTRNGTRPTRYPLTIVPRTFPARTLRVEDKFAEPPRAALGRIERESKAVEAIFARRASSRMWNEAFVAPVPGVATSSFGRRTIVNGEPRAPHSGMDFQAEPGTPVTAPNRGTVVLVADQYFAGRVVIIDHGAHVFSYLAHLSAIDVETGDVVERGQRIALSGATGRVTGPHLHWTLRIGAARVDPLSMVYVTRAR
jgi:hypothetical protein